VVVDNLYVVGVGLSPDKTDAILIVDADGVLAFAVFDQRLQMVVQVVESDDGVEYG